MQDPELKKKLKQAFYAGFSVSNDLPEQIVLVEGSILKTIEIWFEDWYKTQTPKESRIPGNDLEVR